MINKSEYILKSIIKTYLQEQNPIGSMLLQDNLNVPASTIRVYFKRLDLEGYICKLHASGGRIPTQKAMQQYWKNYFSKQKEITLNNTYSLLNINKDYELFAMLIDNFDYELKEVLNINKQFILLNFHTMQTILDYSEDRFNFFSQFLNLDLANIKIILNKLALEYELKQISKMQNVGIYYLCGEKKFANIVKLNSFNSILNSNLLDYFNNDLVFQELFLPENMGVSLDCFYLNKKCKLILAGSIYTNYEEVLNSLKEAM